MIADMITQAIEALEEIGIPAGRGYPGSKIRVLRDPFVTVTLERCTAQAVILAVDVFSPAEQGGSVCEETALQAAGVLTEQMAICTVGECRFAGQTGLFTARVLARRHRELAYAVEIDEVPIDHAIAFKAERTQVRLPYIDATTGETLLTVGAKEWILTVTDIWPLNQKLPVEKDGFFKLLVMRPGGLEVYEECMWTQVTLEETPAGVLRTRVAKTSRDKVVGAG